MMVLPAVLLDTLATSGIDVHGLEEVNTNLLKPMYSVQVSAVKTTEVWHSLRNLVEEAGYWPLFVTDRDMVSRLTEQMSESDHAGFSRIVDEGESLDFEGWLREEEEAGKEYFDFRTELMGEWPDDSEPMHTFTQLVELKVDKSAEIIFEALDTVVLLLCPVTKPWHISALLNFGGWNSCPGPAVHTAAFKYWNERCGAEPAFIAFDTIEFYITNPPSTKETAIDLAIQQYVYCEDRVSQGAESISALASFLLDSTVWYFWWD